MKLSPFFAISTALHAAALFYPISFVPHTRPQFIPVTLISIDESAGGSGQAGMANNSSQAGAPHMAKNNRTTRISLSANRHFSNVDEDAVRSAEPSITARISEPEQQLAAVGNSSSSGAAGGNDSKTAFASLAGTGGGGPGGSGSGDGQGQGSRGTGDGTGAGFGHANSRLTQARYRETPKPLYPEQARKEGQQGRVLLRVLVDQEGRSKLVEVSRSSGNETLDRAAVEAIRLWRFSPARYGVKPVESWVRIPVDFRLSDIADQ